jgi:four helix bundle protein
MIKKFEDLDSWKTARELTVRVYELTRTERCRRDYGFVDQMRRASVSVMNNVAEGFERETNRDFVKFLFIARASAGEVRSMLYVGLDQGYVAKEEFSELCELTNRTAQLCWGMIKHLRKNLDWRSRLSLWLFLSLMPLMFLNR